MIIPLALAGAAAVAGVLGVAARRPDTMRIVRSATIDAPPERIYPLLEDFRGWEAWSPFEKLDPAMRRTYSGAPSGKGAAYAWEGGGKAGAGTMEIVEAAAPSRVAIDLRFTRPFKARNTTELTLEPRGGSTLVTWAMEGPTPFMTKVMCVFVDMDRMIGRDFETGLASLKAIAEA